MEKRIQAIIERCKAIDSEQAAIERDCELNNEGMFNDDQRTKYAALKAEYDTLISEKKQLEDDTELRAARAGRAAELQPRTIERKTPANSGAPLPGQPSGDSGDEPRQVRFKIPANVRPHAPRNFVGVDPRSGMGADERAFRFGQYVLAKISSDLPNRYRFDDAISFVNNYMGGIRNTAHGSDATTGGHFLVPDEFSSDLIVLRDRYGVARRIFGREVMMSDTKHVPKRSTGLTAYFVNENDAITESNMTWEDIKLVAKDLGAIARMSAQLSADAVISVGDELAGEISYAFANKEDECAFNGDGTSTYGGIRGVRHRLTSHDDAGTDSAGLVTGAGNLWSEITAGDLTNVVGKLPQYADTQNCVWVCHRAFYYGVMEKLLLAQGGATSFEAAAGAANSRPRPLYLGYPVEFSQVFPATEANSQVCLAFGDFSLGAKFGDRQQVSIMFSEHAYVNSQSVFERNQIAVRGTERFDIVVHGTGNGSAAGPIVGLVTASA